MTTIYNRYITVLHHCKSATILVFVTLIAMVSAIPARAQVNAEQVTAIGRNVLSMDDYMLAIQYFNLAIKAKPYLDEPYFFRALAKLQLEDYKGAEQDCLLSLERNKFRIDTYRLLGFARQSMGMDSLAITNYNSGLVYNPRDKYMLYYKAVAETELKRFDDADSTFRYLTSIFPGFEDGNAAFGRLDAIRGDTVAAYAHLEKAIGKSTVSPQPYLLRAELFSKQKRWDDALKDMNSAITLQPREPDLYVNRAFVRYNLDDFFGAMSDYNYSLELNPDNEAALFNRALLRYEVKDLDRSAKDLETVLAMNPDNFHAQFNLGLVNLQRHEPGKAVESFKKILRRYPRYHNAYYALGEAYRDLGDMRQAMSCVHQGDELVRKYVTNPSANPLDRPAIERDLANQERLNDSEADIDENEVIDRFNRLVTVSAAEEPNLSYDEKIKGRVQDRDLNVQTAPAYALSFVANGPTLDDRPVYFREMDDFNQRGWTARRLYLRAGSPAPATEVSAEDLFKLATELEGKVGRFNPTAADLVSLGVTRMTLKDYEAAVRAFDKALNINPNLATALVGRAYSRAILDPKSIALVMNDYDEALKLDPRLAFVWYNKGILYYELSNFTSAIECFNKALELDPNLGSALYNRGLTYLRLGNRRLAFNDLSKAGELGILPSYNLLKRMK